MPKEISYFSNYFGWKKIGNEIHLNFINLNIVVQNDVTQNTTLFCYKMILLLAQDQLLLYIYLQN